MSAATSSTERETPKETALHVLGLLLGKDLATALVKACSTNDYAGLLATLPALGNRTIRSHHQAAFEQACQEGRAASVAALLPSEDVAANRVTVPHSTSLHHAIELDHPAVLEVLVSSAKGKACMRVQDVNINAPLADAAGKNRVECLQVLLASDGVDVNAVWEPEYHEVPDIIMACETALTVAVKHGNRQCVEALLAADGINVNARNYTWYRGYNANDKLAGGETTTALMEAIQAHEAGCAEALLNVTGIDINAIHCGQTALHVLTDEDLHEDDDDYDDATGDIADARIVDAMLAVEGIEVNVLDGYGFVPLNFAAFYDKTDVIKSLLARADVRVNVPSHTHGPTALHYASFKGHHESVRAR